MFKRMLVAAACAVGFAAITVDAGAAANHAATLKGRTSQRRPIRLALRHGAVQTKRFSIRLRCRDGSVLIDQESGFQPAPLHGAKLRDHQVGTTDDVWMRARLRGRVLRGKLRVADHLGRLRCNSGWVRFRASARG